MPSFDIISEVEAVELRNAVDNANREYRSFRFFAALKLTSLQKTNQSN